MAEQETGWDKYQNRVRLWRQLLCTIHQLWQDAANSPRDDGSEKWWAAYDLEVAAIRAGESREYDKFLLKRRKKVVDESEAYIKALYLEGWKKKYPPKGQAAETLKWEKQYFQIMRCEGEWVGKRAACCGDKTQPIAIPVGCNHRLCPLCSWRSSQRMQLRTKKLFDRLTHPQFITVTTPNLKRITKKSFEFYRKQVMAFVKGHKEMFSGGIYAIETTFNRTDQGWHLHAHILVDATFALPSKEQRVDFAGSNMPAFTLIKLALEYDWSQLWCGRKTIKLANGKTKTITWDYGQKIRANANVDAVLGARFDFENWVRSCFENRLKVYRNKQWIEIPWLTPEEREERTAWNRANRRVMWIKPVDDRERAAKEVLKYITKSADFCDNAGAVKLFCDATRNARMVQTFGSWYGVNFDADFDTRHMDDWGKLQCACGVNHWERMGVFRFRDVEMSEDGRWYLRRTIDHNSRGTVPRPTIRALEPRREEQAHGISKSHGVIWADRED
jgi:hypothetical protein